MTVDQITREALQLPEKSRAEIVQQLLRSFEDKPDEGIEEAWATEAEKRFQELKSGKVQTSTAEQMISNVLSKLP
jgi:putative addiction module component (TIGR02574 family)